MSSEERPEYLHALPGNWLSAPQPEIGRSPGTLAEAVALHAIEGNPLDAEDQALFELFERENWSPERRRAYIIAAARRALSIAG